MDYKFELTIPRDKTEIPEMSFSSSEENEDEEMGEDEDMGMYSDRGAKKDKTQLTEEGEKEVK